VEERWRVIRELVERWRRVPLPDIGGHAEEIREAEARLGRTLPPSIREWVAFACDVREEHQGFGFVLRDIYQMEELEGYPAVSLLLQGEGDYHWAVRHEDFARPDPPVYGYRWDFEGPAEEVVFVPDGRPPAENVTSFVLEYALSYTRGEGGGFGTDVADPARLLRDLEARFPVRCRIGEMELFEDDDILVRMSRSSLMSERVRERINVEVARPLPREAIPPFLWEYTRNGGWFHGMFTPDRNLPGLPGPPV
jgi:hypothetical protein